MDRGNEDSELAVKKFEMTPPMHPAASSTHASAGQAIHRAKIFGEHEKEHT